MGLRTTAIKFNSTLKQISLGIRDHVSFVTIILFKKFNICITKAQNKGSSLDLVVDGTRNFFFFYNSALNNTLSISTFIV